MNTEQTAGNPAPAPVPPNAPPPAAEPSFYGGKYKTVADLEKAHGELEKKLGSVPAAPAPIPDDLRFTQVLETVGLKADDLAAGLNDESWGKIKGKLPGVSRAMADEYLTTTTAMREMAQTIAVGIAGGEQQLSTLLKFAEQLPEAEKAKTLADLNNPRTFQQALTGLKGAYEKANGSAPQHIEAGAAGGTQGAFRTPDEMEGARREATKKYGDWRQSPEFIARVKATPRSILTAI